MTSHTIYLLIAFLFGGAVSFIIWGWSYHQHKKAWRLEYRRLMGGIEKAYKLIELGNVGQAMRSLSDVYYDKPNWPRG